MTSLEPQAESHDDRPPRPDQSGLPVLVAGAVTTALSLAGELALRSTGTNVMGWYVDYVIPVGALLVGLCASSGFAVASWVFGTKLSGRLLGLTLLLLACGYGAAQWFEFRHLFPGGRAKSGAEVPFLLWFDFATRHFAFSDEHGRSGDPLGLLGYGVRALELVGFVGGGALIPWALRRQPYCDSCNLYMRKKTLAVLPANLPPKLFGDKTPERQEERARLAEQARLGTEAIFAAAAKDAGAVLEAVEAHGPLSGRKAAEKASSRVHFELVRCRGCNRGRLRADMVTQQGRNVARVRIDERDVAPDVVEGIVLQG
jgi:hypothetical protein